MAEERILATLMVARFASRRLWHRAVDTRRRWAVLIAAVVLTLGVAQPAYAVAGTALPFTGEAFDVVVDDAHSRVYVSGGEGETNLFVLDCSGAVVKELAIAGASGMALIGDELFVASSGSSNITVVDTTSTPPAIDRTIPLGSFTRPEGFIYSDLAPDMRFLGLRGLACRPATQVGPWPWPGSSSSSTKRSGFLLRRTPRGHVDIGGTSLKAPRSREGSFA